MTFSADLSEMTRFVDNKSTQFFRGVSFQLVGQTIERTPVKTGRARGGWIPNMGQSPERTDPNGTEATQEAQARIGELKPGDKFVFSNNLPYIIPLEDGSSTQAPQGMVKTTVAAFEQAVRAANNG